LERFKSKNILGSVLLDVATDGATTEITVGLVERQIAESTGKYVVKSVVKELRRPYIRKAVRKKVENRALKTNDGKYIDPNTFETIEGKYDLGHKSGSEFWREKRKAQAEGLSQKEFNNRMNDPDLYQIESPSANRSHRYEMF
jgi:hypothetical protein